MRGYTMKCLLLLALLTLVPLANAYGAPPAAKGGYATASTATEGNGEVKASYASPVAISYPHLSPAAAYRSPRSLRPLQSTPMPLQGGDPPSTQISVGGSPTAIAYDSATEDIYVANCYQSGAEICIIDGNPASSSYQSIVGAVTPSGISYPYGLAVDTQDGDVYVTGYYSDNVGVISGGSIVATVALSYDSVVGYSPTSITFDPSNGYLYVSTSNGVFVIDGNPSDTSTYHTVLADISIGSPQGMVFDPLDDDVYVGSDSSQSVYVVDGTSVATSIPVGIYATALAFDSADSRIYATSYSSGTVAMVGAKPATGSYQTLVGSVSGVGSDADGIAFDSSNSAIYVTNEGSDTISQIDGNPGDTGTYDTVTTTFVEGQSPDGVAVDAADGLAYFSNSYSATVGFTGTLYPLTFQESGLDGGTQWYAMLDGDQVYSTTSSISFTVVSGSYSWFIDSSISCGSDCQFVLTSSSPGSGTVSVPSTTTVSSAYVKEYYLYTEVSPSSGPTPGSAVLLPSSSTAEYVDAGATVEVIATPASGSGFVFQAFSASTSSITLGTYGGSCATGSTCATATVNGAGYITASFTFSGGTPTVTQVSPSSGPTSGGTAVTITGTNFYSVTAVYFGAFEAYDYTVNGPTQITVSSSPAGTGTVDVQVTTPGGTSAANPPNDVFTYTSPPPTVTSLYADDGPVAGGTFDYVYGTNFLGATAVSFGSTSLTAACSLSVTTGCFTVETSGEIYVPSIPAGMDAATSGPVDVTVTTPGGTSPTSAADLFYYEAAPTVTSLSVASGPSAGGTIVVITGTDFIGATSVYFGSAYASFTVNSLTEITATSPADVGTVDVTVTTGQGTSATSSADQFAYVSPRPVVTSLSTTAGPAGTGLYVYGTGFTGATQVLFGTTPASSFYVEDDTEVYAVAPAGSGTVDVTVTTPGGTSATSSADQFTYLALTSISPISGPASGGTLVTIMGSGFTGATAVDFGSTAAASFTVVSGTEITATSPVGTGSVYVTVTTPKGTTEDTSSGYFTYLQVTSISPTSGPSTGGTFVTIRGSGFDQAGGPPVSVYFGTNLGTSITVVSDSEVTVFSPAGSGTVDVTVVTQYGTSPAMSADKFTYTVAAPTVTAVSPATGPASGGTSVAITGTSFISVTSVKFGGVAATDVVVDSTTTITAMSPAGTGTVDVMVTTAYGTSPTSSADQFTYVVKPTVTGLSASSGPATGGTSVTISGSGFTGATSVYFGSTAVSFTFVSDAEITTTSPVGAGTVDVTVANSAGQSATTSADRFTFVPAISLSPSSGAPTQSVAVEGAGFTPGATVSLTYDTATTLPTTPPTVTVGGDGTFSATFAAPTSSAGAHTVTATDSADVSASETFTVTPTVSIDPTTGRVGETITVTGEGFAPGTVTLTYDGYDVGTATADSTGSFTGTFDAPASVAGSHEVSAEDSLNNVAPAVSYTITPFITIKIVGTIVYVTGYGYAGSSPITVYFDGGEVTLTCTGSCDTATTGSFAGSFSYGGGPGTVAASDAAGDLATQTTPAVPTPPNLPPTGITVGYVLEVDGTGFAADCAVTIYYDGVAVTTSPSSVVTDDTGSFSATFVVPPSAYGDHTVTATDCLGNSASQTFMVTPLIAVLPASGDVGQQVTLTGSGFSAASSMTISFNGAALATVTATTDSFGSFTVMFDIPGTGATRANTIGAVDASGHSAPGVTFTINTPSVTSLNPTQGAEGTLVAISGADFTGATAVYFGTSSASGFTVVNSGEISVDAPSGSGTVDVTVTTPGGTSATSSADQFTYTEMVTAALSDGVAAADAYVAPTTAPLTDGVQVADTYVKPVVAPLTDGMQVADTYVKPITAALKDLVSAADSLSATLGFRTITPAKIVFHDPPDYFLVTTPGGYVLGCDSSGTPENPIPTLATVTGCSSSEETVTIDYAPGTYVISITGTSPVTITVETLDSNLNPIDTAAFAIPTIPPGGETIYADVGASQVTITTSPTPPSVPEFPGSLILVVVAALFLAMTLGRTRGQGTGPSAARLRISARPSLPPSVRPAG